VSIAALAAVLAVRPPRRAATRHSMGVLVLWTGLLLPLVPRWGPGLWRPASALTITPLVPTPAVAQTIEPSVSRELIAPRRERPAVPAMPPRDATSAAPSEASPAAVEPMGVRRLLVLGLSAPKVRIEMPQPKAEVEPDDKGKNEAAARAESGGHVKVGSRPVG
jgi:hypothetical protein